MSRTTAAELRGVFGRFLRALEAEGVNTSGWALERYAYRTPRWHVLSRTCLVRGGCAVVLPLGDTPGEAWRALDVASRALESLPHARCDCRGCA